MAAKKKSKSKPTITMSATNEDVTINNGTGTDTLSFSSSASVTEPGKIEGEYWVWPNNLKTPLRAIAIAVRKRKNLPFGFYKEAERVNRTNLNLMVHAAKAFGLEDNVKLNG